MEITPFSFKVNTEEGTVTLTVNEDGSVDMLVPCYGSDPEDLEDRYALCVPKTALKVLKNFHKCDII